jgi:hypothetical protein|tara:strand:- start:134 stop:517 length:384 start_codon:yes stop_codon:yes gene_type:complete
MTEKVDALFSGDLPLPPSELGPRLERLRQTLWVAIALDVLGIPCWTSVPGAILTLYVWLSTDTDTHPDELHSTDELGQLGRLRKTATWALVFCVASLMAQIFLLSTSFYERLWGSLSVVIQHLWQSV